jgi:LysW-gamma-L-lysine carboxypeptidase
MMDSAVRLLVDSVKVYSPSEEEEKLASMLSGRMKGEFGFRNVHTDRAGNVVGEVGSGPLRLLLCGHMDTVPGEIPVRVDERRVYGRGAVDAKSALCAMIVSASTMMTPGLRITVAAVTREEGDSLGVNTLIEEGGNYDCAVFGEPAGANRLTVGYRGRIAVHVVVRSEGGHASSPWAHKSAIDESMVFLQRIAEYEREHTAGDNHYRSVSSCLTLISGGTYSNVVPDVCKMTLDVRVPVGMSCADVRGDIEALAERHRQERGTVDLAVSFDEATEPYESDASSVLVRSFQRSIIKNLSEKPVLIRKTGTGDMNTLAEKMSIPVITYGPGNSVLEHTSRESVEIVDYLKSIRVLRGVFDELLYLSKKQ